MKRPSLAELETRCQKPDHRTVGNWMARRITRPMALRVTWIVIPLGVTAHMTTLAAWACAVAAAIAFGHGGVGGWLAGAALLQLWYLLDHVDGQLARFHRSASLDGVQLDYMMHHTVNLLIPLGVGYGLFHHAAVRLAEFPFQPFWLLAGLAWGLGLLVLGLRHDARYKAMFGRLKRVEGRLLAIGGGGSRPRPTPPIPRSPLRFVAWAARKVCETHVIANSLLLVAVGEWVLEDPAMALASIYLILSAVVAASVAAIVLAREIRRETSEHEFAAWFGVADDEHLVFDGGWWKVDSTAIAPTTNVPTSADSAQAGPERKSGQCLHRGSS